MSKEQQENFRQLATYSHVGLSFVFSIIIGFGMGWYLDEKLFSGNTSPWFTFIFLAFGIGAGFKNLWELTRELQDKERK